MTDAPHRDTAALVIGGTQGLGLAIAVDLADRHGLRLERCPARRGGAGIALVIPAAKG